MKIKYTNPFVRCLYCLMIAAAVLCGLVGAGCSGGSVGGSGSQNGISIDPKSVSLSPGQTQVFRASAGDGTPTGITWKVDEGDAGGTVTAVSEDTVFDYAVTYTAPQTSGTYHVRSTATFKDGMKSDTATVEVK